jgi:hypothetical protein
MTAAGLLLAAWLTPAVWLSIPTLIVDRGPDGLWVGLALIVVPLVALGVAPSRRDARASEAVFPVVALLFTVGILFWANLSLAGDVSVWVGWPRWYGIVIAAGGACLLAVVPGAGRLATALLLVAALGVSVPLLDLARASGVGPIAAWDRVASRTAFRFPASSPWVTDGRELSATYGRAPIRFDEEHRVTAAAGGRLYAYAVDGVRVGDLEWTLAPGQSVTFRPGDRIQLNSTARLRFESDKRVPGAPTSGMSWASGRTLDWPRSVGLVVTVLFGALALCRTVAPVATPRTTVALVACGGLMVFLWGQGWAVYSLLASPDLFLGSVTAERLLTLPALVGDPARDHFQTMLLAGGLAAFLASSIALRECLATLDRTGGGEIGRDLGLWTGVIAIAGLGSLWHFDCWALVLLALGIAASSVSPGFFGSRATSPTAVTVAGVVGLVVFLALTVAEQLQGSAAGALGAILAYPAVIAVPSAALVLWVVGALARR